MQAEKLTKQELKKTTKDILEKLEGENTENILLQFLKDQRYDKFTVFIWLNTSTIFECILLLWSNNVGRFLDSSAAQILQIVNLCCDDTLNNFLFSKSKGYLSLITKNQNCKKKLLEVRDKLRKEEKQVKSELKKLTMSLNSVENRKPFNKKDFNSIVEQIVSFSHVENIFDEICFNWLRDKAQKIRKDDIHLCCKTIFFKGEHLLADESASQEFKKYTWPISNKNIIHHLSKTIVGLLNNKKGGIIYVGIFEDKNKNISVVGISLSVLQIKEILDFMRKDIIGKIYPQHQAFKIKKDNYEINPMNGKFILNDYVSVQYECIVSHSEDELIYTNAEQNGKQLYIVKVCVKPGHPKHLYHLINDQNGLDFFVRDDRNVEKRPFPEAHKMILARLETFEKAVDNEGERYFLKPEPFHEYCRFNVETFVDYDQDDDLQ